MSLMLLSIKMITFFVCVPQIKLKPPILNPTAIYFALQFGMIHSRIWIFCWAEREKAREWKKNCGRECPVHVERLLANLCTETKSINFHSVSLYEWARQRQRIIWCKCGNNCGFANGWMDIVYVCTVYGDMSSFACSFHSHKIHKDKLFSSANVTA